MSARRGGAALPHKVKDEVYATPSGAVDALLKLIKFYPGDTFFEPCRGDGAIYDKVPLREEQKGFAEIRQGIDFLTGQFAPVDVIITNPPFSLSTQFLIKSMSMLKPNGTLIFLQRLDWRGTIQRLDFWQNEVPEPHKLPVLVPRPRFDGRSDSCEYGWFTWDYGKRTRYKRFGAVVDYSAKSVIKALSNN